MENIKTDLLVIGAGPGGYVAAIRGAQLGLQTIVVEDGQVGGVCLNWGCIPSKALIEAASTFSRMQKEIPEMGVTGVEGAAVDVGKLQAWKNDIVNKLTSGVKTLFKGNGIRLINGRAKLKARNAVHVETKEGPVRVEATKGIIVATGGEPIELPGLKRNGNEIICAKEAVSLGEIPGRLAVIGGGVIGLELGTVYRKLGSKVDVIEMMPAILPGLDPDIQAVCSRRLRQLKIQVRTSAKATGLEQKDRGFGLFVEKEGESPSSIPVDKVLVAAGMRPKTDGLGFEDLGIEIDRSGFVVTDEYCRTNVPGIYAVGDIAGQPMLAHKASFEGEVAAEAIAGKAGRTARALIPSAVFTDPEIGVVGKTEEQAVEAGYKVKTGKFFFAASGKAMAMQETHGLVKVVADAETGKTLGVHIAGPHASDLLGEAALAVSLGLTPEQVGHIVHAHPTLGEVLAEGFLSVDGNAIHAVRR
jgi:dihydrolipoamide dehydrogenase